MIPHCYRVQVCFKRPREWRERESEFREALAEGLDREYFQAETTDRGVEADGTRLRWVISNYCELTPADRIHFTVREADKCEVEVEIKLSFREGLVFLSGLLMLAALLIFSVLDVRSLVGMGSLVSFVVIFEAVGFFVTRSLTGYYAKKKVREAWKETFEVPGE